MADVLDEIDFGELRGTFLAKIMYSGLRTLPDDPSIEQWKIKWVITDEDSVYNGEAIWENFYFYPQLTKDDVEALPFRDQASLRRRRNDRNARLTSLGVSEDELDNADLTSFAGIEKYISVNTNNRGKPRITAVHDVNGEDEVATESTSETITI